MTQREAHCTDVIGRKLEERRVPNYREKRKEVRKRESEQTCSNSSCTRRAEIAVLLPAGPLVAPNQPIDLSNFNSGVVARIRTPEFFRARATWHRSLLLPERTREVEWADVDDDDEHAVRPSKQCAGLRSTGSARTRGNKSSRLRKVSRRSSSTHRPPVEPTHPAKPEPIFFSRTTTDANRAVFLYCL